MFSCVQQTHGRDELDERRPRQLCLGYVGFSTRSTTRTSLLRGFSRAATAYDPFRIRPHEILQSGIFEGGQKGFIGGLSDEEEGRVVDDEAKRLDDECSVSTESTPEEAPVKRPPNTSDPTLAGKEAHCACGHLPARPWCLVCVKGRGKEDPHYMKKSNTTWNMGYPR